MHRTSSTLISDVLVKLHELDDAINGDDFNWTRQLENTGQTNGSTASGNTGPDGASSGSYFLFLHGFSNLTNISNNFSLIIA